MPGSQWKFELGRHDSDYDVRLTIELDLASQNVRIRVQPVLPQRMTENGHGFARVVFLLGKEAAHHRGDLQSRKQFPGHTGSIHLRRFAKSRQFKAGSLIPSETFETV